MSGEAGVSVVLLCAGVSDLAVCEIEDRSRHGAPVGQSAMFDSVIKYHRIASRTLQRNRSGRYVKVCQHVTAS